MSKCAMDMHSAITCFDPISPEQVDKATTGKLNYLDLEQRLAKVGLDINKVIHDPSRQQLHTYYCDFDRGIYGHLPLDDLTDDNSELKRLACLAKNGNYNLKRGRWEYYYGISLFLTADEMVKVPVPLLIYDFSRRLKNLPEEQVFTLWRGIYRIVSFANGMWTDEVLEYVFQFRPAIEELPLDESGILHVYRCTGELSQPPGKAVSWSTSRKSAVEYATRDFRGVEFISGEVAPEDVLYYTPRSYEHDEVLVRPGTMQNIHHADMIPATDSEISRLTMPVMKSFVHFGHQVRRFIYHKYEMSGIENSLRVLMLSLIYFYNSGDRLTKADRNILIYFSLLHGCCCGPRNHKCFMERNAGYQSLEVIDHMNYRIANLPMSKKDLELARFLILFHCREDEEGLETIASDPFMNRRDKERARLLDSIVKDISYLGNAHYGSDPAFLRTEFGRRLPLVAAYLQQEDILGLLNGGRHQGKHC